MATIEQLGLKAGDIARIGNPVFEVTPYGVSRVGMQRAGSRIEVLERDICDGSTLVKFLDDQIPTYQNDRPWPFLDKSYVHTARSQPSIQELRGYRAGDTIRIQSYYAYFLALPS